MFYLRETKLTSCEKEILIDLENRYVIYQTSFKFFSFAFLNWDWNSSLIQE